MGAGQSTRLRVAVWLCRFAAHHGAAFTYMVVARAVSSRKNRVQNRWPAMMDLVVTALRTSIALAPPSVMLVVRQVGDGSKSFFGTSAPRPGTTIEGIQGALKPISGEWVIHPSVGSIRKAVILYLHGGGYAFLSVSSHRAMIARISKAAGCPAFALDYTLSTKAPFPVAMLDAVAAYKWLMTPEGGSFASYQIVIAGDSAGGGLTMSTLLHLRDNKLPMPGGAIGISGWFDLECSGPSWSSDAECCDYLPGRESKLLQQCAHLYAGSLPLSHPNISHINAALHNLPPLLLQVGSIERCLSDSVTLAQRVRLCGGSASLQIYRDMPHVFQAFGPMCPSATAALRHIGQFVHAVTHFHPAMSTIPPTVVLPIPRL